MHFPALRTWGLACALIVVTSVSQGETIQGTVMDLAGNPLRDLKNGIVTITIGTNGSRGTMFFSIDAEGKYEIRLRPDDQGVKHDFAPNDRILTMQFEADGRIKAVFQGVALTNQTIDPVLPRAELVCEQRRCFLRRRSATVYERSAGPDAESDSNPAPSTPQAAVPAATKDDLLYSRRAWTNATHTRSVTATFVSQVDGIAYFRSPSGRLLSTAMEQLSRADQELIQQAGLPPAPQLAGH